PLSLFLFHPHPPPHISPLSLHDALPISWQRGDRRIESSAGSRNGCQTAGFCAHAWTAKANTKLDGCRERSRFYHRVLQSCGVRLDRKSTRLNSSHRTISYAVFCLKKKKK